MPGPGTCATPPPGDRLPRALALDLTRLVSRVGRGPHTGIDRVERAYLSAVLAHRGPVAGVVGLRGRVHLLDRPGLEGLAARLDGQESWGPPSLLARLGLGGNTAPAADVTRLSAASGRPGEMAVRLAGLLGGGCYLNVGHTHLEAGWLAALGKAGLGRAVMIHDLIPLEHPEWSGEGAPARFARRFAATLAHADLVLANSSDTAARVQGRARAVGREVPVLPVPLGLAPLPCLSLPSPLLAPGVPAFVVLGTIEPRKNHALLFKVWERLAADAPNDNPHLHVIGRRGWAGPEVTDWLDRSPLMGVCVFEHSGLDDAAAMSLLAGARALLFPSLAEGFGLPAREAVRLGVPVICSDLPALREQLGDAALYLDAQDAYSWTEAVTRMASAEDRPTTSGSETAWLSSTGWEQHFRKVFPALPDGWDAATGAGAK